MSKTRIPEKIIYTLWGLAGGTCEICGAPLTIDVLTKRLWSRGYIAHVYGERKNGPRYDKKLSKKYCKDINYLMLLCDSCHRLVDKEEKEKYDASKLLTLKKNHEEKVACLMQAINKPISQAVTLNLKIGENTANDFDNNMLIEAIIKNGKRPASTNPFALLTPAQGLDDSHPEFWNYYQKEMVASYNRFKGLYADYHLSVFAIAPQPLLILLGNLLGELNNADIYQKHREEKTWIWPKDNNEDISFIVNVPDNPNLKNVAIKFSLSDSISDYRVVNVLGESTSIWEITIDNPNKNFVKNSKIQQTFKNCLEEVLSDIHLKSPDVDFINIFPAVPQSIAICIGQVRMPKAQKPYVVYDENRKTKGFLKTITIE